MPGLIAEIHPAPPVASPLRSGHGLPISLLGILVAYLVLAAAFSLATPILEASDENSHTAVVWNIAAGHGLPVLALTDRGKVLVPAQEAGQPPLYYLVVAAATAWIHFPSPAGGMLPNPYSDIGHPDQQGWNKNLLIHTPAEDFPWHGLSLAVHLGRLVSILCGAITVTLVYALARIVAPGVEAVHALAAALTAFNPMFLFISASVDNDAPAFLLATVVIVLLARTITDDRASLPRELAIGGVVGLAVLTKLNAGAIAAPAAAVFLWLAWRRRSWRSAVRALAILGLTIALIDGWWLLRNWALYADPSGLSRFLAIAGHRTPPLTFQELLAELPGVWISFWGVFGIFDVLLPQWYYTLADLLGLAALAGLLLAILRRSTLFPRRAPGMLLLGWLALEAVLLVRWSSLTLASTGRLLFPALACTSIFFAVGLAELARRARALSVAAISALLGLGAALALPLAILPAYAQPLFVPAAELRPNTPVGYRYGNLDLVGASVSERVVQPGSVVKVQFTWVKRGATQRDYAVSVQMHGPDRLLIARTDELPGGGKALTSQWPAGMGLQEAVPLRLPSTVSTPFLGRISVYVYPVNRPDERVTATSDAGQELSDPLVGAVEVRGSGPPIQPTALPQPVHATFGGRMEVTSVQVPAQGSAGELLAVGVQWRAAQAPGGNFAAVLTARSPDGQPAFTLASVPHDGLLPTIDWVAGETIADTLTAPLSARTPPGIYTLGLGLVDLSSGARLATADGTAEATIGHIVVVAAGPGNQAQTLEPDLVYGGLRLLRITVPGTPIASGEQVPVALVWRVEHRLAQDEASSIQLHGPDGVLLAQQDVEPGGSVATSSWLPGLEISNVVTLSVAAGAPAPSLAILSISVYPQQHPDRPITAESRQGQSGSLPVVARLALRPTSGQVALPPPLPLQPNAVFGGTIRLLGADVPARVVAGTLLVIPVQWQTVSSPQADYTVFVHALDSHGSLAFQFDGRPHAGKLPTTDWVAGQVVTDSLTIPVAAGTPPGAYRLMVGLYQLQTGARLPLADGQTEYPLSTVTVVAPGGA